MTPVHEDEVIRASASWSVKESISMTCTDGPVRTSTEQR
jgi:hypothetical protein